MNEINFVGGKFLNLKFSSKSVSRNWQIDKFFTFEDSYNSYKNNTLFKFATKDRITFASLLG